ncbi:aldo/keto reductase [bacterium]|nr:aldo/keto reductase [bacterium]
MKIALGSVQFGIPYGVSNNEGKTSKKQALSILNFAQKKGIRTIDTAPSYGDSERVLGKLFEGEEWDITTKTLPFNSKSINEEQIEQLRSVFRESLVSLHKKSIYGLLVHSCNDLLKPGGEKIFREMERLREIGMVKKIGVSVYNSKQIAAILGKFNIDLIQLPINILDQRLVSGGQLTRLKNHGVEIHARSVFLQGLLLMSPNNIPSWFDPVRGVLESFHKEAKKRNMSVLQLALSFVQSIDEIDKVIVGVNTLRQLQEVVSAASIRVNTTELSYISIDDPAFINPVNWKI